MGLWDTTNLLKNGYFSTDTTITGSCSLRNDGKSILAGGLVVEGNLTATASQTIDFGANVPKSSGTPTAGSDLVNKTYADANYHPIGSYMDLTTNQTVTTGTKTFNVAPVVPRLGMVSANSTFVGNNMNTTASEGTYVGFQAGRLQNNLASRNTAIGCNALDRLPQSNQNTAVGYQALYLFADGGSLANTALGAYSLATLRSGSRNIGVGTAAGNGLVNSCSNNVAFASDSISNSSNLTLFTYKNISGANVGFANPFIIDPVRFDTTGGTIRARMYMRFYNGTAAGAARIESYDSATYSAVLQSAAGSGAFGCAKDASLRFTQGGTDASIDTNYTGAGGTGTTFTIATGLGTIPAGYIMVYSTTATMTKWATVSSYNSTTGVLILTTSITLVAGLINFFASNTDRGSYVNNCCAIGAGALQNFACGQTAPMNGNCAFGQNALNGAGGGYDNASYLSGSYNTAFGNNAGSWNTSSCAFNTFLGADTNILVPYSLIYGSTAIGYGAKLDLSNLIVLGTAFETTRCWAMDVRGLPNFSAGLTVSAGAITLPANSISDAYLSNNIPLKNGTNTFSNTNTFSGGITATATQTINFGANVPTTTGVPINGSDLVNKTYVDSSFHPIGSYVDLSSNQTVGGVKSFTSNLRAIATTGDVFQAYKNSGVGNAGHILVNGDGNLLYYDTTASAIKWRLDTSGNLTVGSIDLSGTLISKTTTGDFIRSNSNATQYFYASNNGEIGYSDSTSNMGGKRWFINAGGGARFVSSSNSFKYWELAGNLFRYYNLGGTHSIIMSGDSGNISTPGAISSASLTTTGNILINGTIVSNDIECGNIDSTGYINCGNINSTGDIGVTNINSIGQVNAVNVVASADITASTGGVFAVNLEADNDLTAGNQFNLVGNLSKIIFSGVTESIRVGLNSTLTTDSSDHNINIGNDSTALGGLNFVGGKSATGAIRSVAVGSSSVAGTNAVAVGSGASANNVQSIAVGHLAIVNGQQSIGVGEGVLASSLQGVALGAEAESTNTQVISIGYQAKGNQVNAIAIGATATAHGQNSVALGFESQANATQCVAIGHQSRANFANTVSIGQGVQATVANQLLLGNTSNNILVSQLYYPWEISPTTITASSTLSASPLYGWYLIATTAAGAYTITIPVITAQMIGYTLNFRKTNSNALGSTCSIISSAGNSYMPLNSITATSTATAFIGGTATTGRILIINSTQFAVLN